MFYDYIRKQGSDEYVIRAAVSVYGWDRRLKPCQAFAVAAGIASGLMVLVVMVIMHGTLLFDRQVLFHANHSVGVVMMGNNCRYQHDNVDKKQQSYYNSFLPFHPFF